MKATAWFIEDTLKHRGVGLVRRLSKGLCVKVSGLILLLGGFSSHLAAAEHEHGGNAATVIQMGPSVLTVMTSAASLLFVLSVVVILVFRMRAKKNTFSKMTGMMAAMAIAMVSSLVVGTVAGVMLEQLFLSTVVGVTFGMVVGYASGRPLLLLAALDGMLAGLMGGMMGAMLGVMVISDYPSLSIMFMDVVLAVTMLILYKLLHAAENSAVHISDSTLQNPSFSDT